MWKKFLYDWHEIIKNASIRFVEIVASDQMLVLPAPARQEVIRTGGELQLLSCYYSTLFTFLVTTSTHCYVFTGEIKGEERAWVKFLRIFDAEDNNLDPSA